MSVKLKFSTVEAADYLGITPLWFRLCAKKKGIEAQEVEVTGKRGRPGDLWTLEQVKAVRA